MADITSTEGREELRRKLGGAICDEDLASLATPVVFRALDLLDRQEDGLDIAEEIVDWLKGDRVQPNVWLADLIRKWDTWKGK